MATPLMFNQDRELMQDDLVFEKVPPDFKTMKVSDVFKKHHLYSLCFETETNEHFLGLLTEEVLRIELG